MKNSAQNIYPENDATNLLLKVCGMRTPENIAEISALKPDYIGFIFYPKSGRFVGQAYILENIPGLENIKKVGVFVNEQPAKIKELVKKYNLKAVQLHGEESPEICQELKKENVEVIKAFSMADNFDFTKIATYEGTCDYYLFDTKGQNYGGNGTTFNWEILQKYTGRTPFFLSGGIDLEHAAQIKNLRLTGLAGIDVNSKFEISPGLKDANKVKDFFNNIRKR